MWWVISVDSPNATLLADQLYDNFLFQLVKDLIRNRNILVYDLKVSLPFSDHNLISMLL